MPFALPSKSNLTSIGISKPTFRASLNAIIDFLSGLLGSSGTQKDALTALGAPLNGKVDKVGAYTVVATDRGKVMSCSGTFTLALSASATLGDGFVFGVQNVGSGTITIDPNLAEQIDGAATAAVPPGDLVLYYCNGSAWRRVGAAVTSVAISSALGYTPPNPANVAGQNANFDWSLVSSYTYTGSAINLHANWGQGLYLLRLATGPCWVVAVTGSFNGGSGLAMDSNAPDGEVRVTATSVAITAPITTLYIYKLRKLV